MKPGPWKLALDNVILVVSLGFILCGLFLVAILPFAGDDASTYSNAPQCQSQLDAFSQLCYSKIDATVVSVVVTNTNLGANKPTITVHWTVASPQTFTLQIPQPTTDYYNSRKGEKVQIKVWNDIPTAVYVPNGTSVPGALRTSFNPLIADAVRFTGGLSLLGLGAVLLVAHPPLILRRYATKLVKAGERRWHHGTGLAAHVANDMQMRVALGVFIVLQVLDIVTSIKGGRVGLYEGNQLAAAVITSIGPVLGFTLLKIPAVIAILLVMARLPRWAALLVVWLGSLAFLLVVLSNLELIWFKSSPY